MGPPSSVLRPASGQDGFVEGNKTRVSYSLVIGANAAGFETTRTGKGTDMWLLVIALLALLLLGGGAYVLTSNLLLVVIVVLVVMAFAGYGGRSRWR
jgi:hypothetical protein